MLRWSISTAGARAGSRIRFKSGSRAIIRFFYFEADPGAIANVERACRLDEDVLRHLILQTEIPPQVEEDEAEEAAEEVIEAEVAE